MSIAGTIEAAIRVIKREKPTVDMLAESFLPGAFVVRQRTDIGRARYLRPALVITTCDAVLDGYARHIIEFGWDSWSLRPATDTDKPDAPSLWTHSYPDGISIVAYRQIERALSLSRRDSAACAG